MRKLTVLLVALAGALAAVVATVVLTPPKTLAAPALPSLIVSGLPIEKNMPSGGPWDAF